MKMDEIDPSDIWQQILRLNILDTDSENSSVIGSSGKPAEIAADYVLNLNDDDIATLAAAIDKVEIVDTRGSMDIKPKRKRGRPKKRVIQRCEYTFKSPSHTSSSFCEQARSWYPRLCLTIALRQIPIPIGP
jgi:hypothetical protein